MGERVIEKAVIHRLLGKQLSRLSRCLQVRLRVDLSAGIGLVRAR